MYMFGIIDGCNIGGRGYFCGMAFCIIWTDTDASECFCFSETFSSLYQLLLVQIRLICNEKLRVFEEKCSSPTIVQSLGEKV